MTLIQRFLTNNPCYKANINRQDSRYTTFQQRGALGLMLHSVGCAQPDATKFISAWNKASYTNSCVHGVIDANTGIAYQTLPWWFRGWHGGGTSNNTHVGVEMCESGYIKYVSSTKFVVLDPDKAKADCKRTYDSAVSLFTHLCIVFGLNPMTDIVSHKEGYAQGIASNHGDPEHYWSGLGIGYTMDGFRSDVKRTMEEQQMPTADELEELINAMLDKQFPERWQNEYNTEKAKLNDNDAGAWSKNAREWAIETGLVAGVGKLPDGTTNYAWQQPLTREQFVTIEYKRTLEGDKND